MRPSCTTLCLLVLVASVGPAYSWLQVEVAKFEPLLTDRQNKMEHSPQQSQGRRNNMVLYSTASKSSSSSSQVGDSPDDESSDDNDGDWWDVDDLEVLQGQGDDFFDDGDDEAEWIPDGEMARRKRRMAGPSPAAAAVSDTWHQQQSDSKKRKKSDTPSPYTEEEEELIEAMGGKVKPTKSGANKQREDGFLGDSTLQEIATDYSVPVCYLADVLTTWGVPVPINVQDRLGDLVTGEQAFALVEAVNSLDVADLHDRYSNQSLIQVCADWDIELKDAFEFAMKEDWSLPFGVQTNLRVEQEDELIRVLSTY